MTHYIHVSTTHGEIGIDVDAMSTSCTVDLLSRPMRGPMVPHSINFDITHTCEGPDLKADFAALEAKIRAKGSEIAEAYIAARASEVA